MWRDAFQASFELALVKEAQTGREKGDYGCGLQSPFRKDRRGARFVVIFEEAGEFVLVSEVGLEVSPYGCGMALTKAVVQTFIIGIIEALLLHRPLEVPIDFRHEQKIGIHV